ncbi:MAG: dihydroorotate dehydrogenase electron transfer subunit [Peptoniphilaceae bacterium]
MASEQKVKILKNTELVPGVGKLVVSCDDSPLPGQFYMLRAWEREPLLSRPISVGRADQGELSFYYLVKGKGTRLLQALKEEESLLLFGPLGKGFPKEEGSVALVGGGIGIAPLIELSHRLPAAPDVYVGFLDTPYALEAFRAQTLAVATDSGRVGHKGFVTELLKPESYDAVYACGPTPMLSALKKLCEGKTRLYVSLEAHMACGVGACLGCAVPSGDSYVRVCKDGPVFLAEEVEL